MIYTLEQINEHNKKAWDFSASESYKWCVPISEEILTQAKQGSLALYLSPKTAVPSSWLKDLKGKKVLALAAGGGQQGPLLAAFGCEVTVFDLSPLQLQLDQKIAEKFGLTLQIVQGSADDMSMFSDLTFDYIINPVSNCFFKDLQQVWQECHRILKPEGKLIYGFINPIAFLFDFEKANLGQFQLKYSQPYSDIHSLNEQEKSRFLREQSPLEFGHSLQQQIGDLTKLGFVLTGLFEDYWDSDEKINAYFPQFINVCAKKLTPTF